MRLENDLKCELMRVQEENEKLRAQLKQQPKSMTVMKVEILEKIGAKTVLRKCNTVNRDELAAIHAWVVKS